MATDSAQKSSSYPFTRDPQSSCQWTLESNVRIAATKVIRASHAAFRMFIVPCAGNAWFEKHSAIQLFEGLVCRSTPLPSLNCVRKIVKWFVTFSTPFSIALFWYYAWNAFSWKERKGMEKTALRDACTNGREGTASVAGTVLRDNVRKRVESCTRYVCVSE